MCARGLALFAISVVAVNAAPTASLKKGFLEPKAHDALVYFMTDVAGAQGIFNQWMTALDASKPHLTRAQFNMQCSQHTRTLIESIDSSYTSAQLIKDGIFKDSLMNVLEADCKTIELFPAAKDKNPFATNEACMDIAKDLVRLRDEELQSQNTDQYGIFCDGLYSDLGEQAKHGDENDADEDDTQDNGKDTDEDGDKDDNEDKDDGKGDEKAEKAAAEKAEKTAAEKAEKAEEADKAEKAAEKTAAEKAEKAAAEKATAEKAEQAAAEKAAAEKAENAAAEKAAAEKAEKAAAEKAKKAATEQAAAEKVAAEKAGKAAAEKAEKAAAQTAEKAAATGNGGLSWKALGWSKEDQQKEDKKIAATKAAAAVKASVQEVADHFDKKEQCTQLRSLPQKLMKQQRRKPKKLQLRKQF